ncbi:MAG: dihydroorotase family protein [Candidatus Lokiarchaeota archaeon]|nr:dihydroorotase family protein [Candidatus Lokiarchaeota archaeon]
MILDNLRAYIDGKIRNATIFIQEGVIKEIKTNPLRTEVDSMVNMDKEKNYIDCQGRIGIPGIIDIHSHLRDMEQSEKETFQSATEAAAFSGITTVFNMPNTIPPATTANQVKKWMEKAKDKIHIDVGFIAGVPKEINEEEMEKILRLGVIGFKVYPHDSLSGIDWMDPLSIKKILCFSSRYQVPIFFHPDIPLNKIITQEKFNQYLSGGKTPLIAHDMVHKKENEVKFIEFVLENYYKIVSQLEINQNNLPIVHFCHVSTRSSFKLLKESISKLGNKQKISFEITPHHLLLSREQQLNIPTYGKVMPPLRACEDQEFLLNKLNSGEIELIGTDHAPHTIFEKSKSFLDAPSGFPGFETYPFLLLESVPIEMFVKISSENPAKTFGLKHKGFIKKGFNADITILEMVSRYTIDAKNFKSLAKFSPFDGWETSIKIWKVFLRGKEIKQDVSNFKGQILFQTITH